MSDVQIVASSRASFQASCGVRTLWPSTSPMSNTSRTIRSASGATRSQRRRFVKNHHVDIGIGGNIGAAIAAVGHQGDLRGQPRS